MKYKHEQESAGGSIRALAASAGLKQLIDRNAAFDVCGNDPYIELSRDIEKGLFGRESLRVAMLALVSQQGSTLDVNDLRRAATSIQNDQTEIPRPYATN